MEKEEQPEEKIHVNNANAIEMLLNSSEQQAPERKEEEIRQQFQEVKKKKKKGKKEQKPSTPKAQEQPVKEEPHNYFKQLGDKFNAEVEIKAQTQSTSDESRKPKPSIEEMTQNANST